MEKILLFETEKAAAEKIQKAASALGIKTVEVSRASYGETLGKIAESPARLPKVEEPESGFSQSLLMFCDVTEKHMDKILAMCRKEGISVDFKAVLTSTNRNWEPRRLYLELMKERAFFSS